MRFSSLIEVVPLEARCCKKVLFILFCNDLYVCIHGGNENSTGFMASKKKSLTQCSVFVIGNLGSFKCRKFIGAEGSLAR